MELPFRIGALYSRRDQIHRVYGGQQQGGISTPTNHPLVIIFTGEAGEAHGYADYWDDDGYFHYYGEGQNGDMEFKGGNRAILDHVKNGKRLIAFQAMGKRKPYRYRGEFISVDYDVIPGVPDTKGAPRNAIVFKLQAVDESERLGELTEEAVTDDPMTSTFASRLTDIRTKQTLFRRRLLMVEQGCRLTKITDLRFLRASHIKPWALCTSASERTDGSNGLLLAPHADLLFDHGWISFGDNGELMVADGLPEQVVESLGIQLKIGHIYGTFAHAQRQYLYYHRTHVFRAT